MEQKESFPNAKGFVSLENVQENRGKADIVLIISMIPTEVAHTARKWETFTLPLGQVVYKGRYYFAWCKGRFTGTYQTLDDAVESLERWYEENPALESSLSA
jgi:hypothetical protein